MESITIDGSLGEGGGQILRTSLVYSALTGKQFRIVNIRGNRPKPGLRKQHVGCVKLAEQMTGAYISEVNVGTRGLSFIPGKAKPGIFSVDIVGGSITLLVSVFLPIALVADGACCLNVRGGTDVPFAPTSSYFQHAFLPLLSGFFSKIDLSVLKRGYFPLGKGKIRLSVERNSALAPLSFLEKGDQKETSLYVTSTNLPDHISRRLCSSFDKEMKIISRNHFDDINFIVNNTYSPDTWRVGVSACSVTKFESGIIARSRCGMKNIPTERIGKKLARDHLNQIEQPCIDSNLADQIFPYVGLFGGEICVKNPSRHFLTGLRIFEKFLGKNYSLKKDGDLRSYSFRPWYRSCES